MKWSEVAQLCPTLCDPMDYSLPASPSMGFSRQEYWGGFPFPSPGIFTTQELNPGLLNCRQTLYPLSHLEAYTFKCIYHSLLNHSYVCALRMLLVFFNYSAAMNNPAFILLQLFLQNRFLGMRLLCQKVRVYTFVAYCQILFQKKGVPDCISTGSVCITFP